jgi:hypothetical protein
LQERGRGVTILASGVTPEPIDRPAARGGDDPPRRAGRPSGGGPPLHRNGERFLDCLLGKIDVSETSHQDGHRAAVLLAEDTLDLTALDRCHLPN